MGYNTLASGGSYSGYKDLYIRLYANTSSIESRLTSYVENGFSSILDQLLNNNAIDYYQISLCDENFNISFSDKGDFLSKFRSECKDRGYDAYIGAHLAAGTGMNGGVAYSGTNYSSFKQPTYGVFNCDGTPKEAEKNVAIQEAFHGVIDTDLSGIRWRVTHGMTNSEEGDNDHDLGKVYSDGSVSPMCTGYDDSHARHGDCANSNAWFGFYKATLTDCTVAATKINAEEYS
jgi:hypothetical protein